MYSRWCIHSMTSVMLWQFHGCRATHNDIRWVNLKLDRWDGMSSWHKDNGSSMSVDGWKNWFRGIFPAFLAGVKIILTWRAILGMTDRCSNKIWELTLFFYVEEGTLLSKMFLENRKSTCLMTEKQLHTCMSSLWLCHCRLSLKLDQASVTLKTVIHISATDYVNAGVAMAA